MAGYKTHITVSGALGVGYGTAGVFLAGFTPVEGALAGVLTWFSGMLPDLDSASGRPVREVFSLLAAFAPFAMMGHLMEWTHHSYEAATLLAVILYVTIRYGGQSLLNRTAVHRGMFHSIPAMLIAAEIAFLGFRGSSFGVKLFMAGGAAVGFFSHLVLDEIYAVEWNGAHVRLNKFAGSAGEVRRQPVSAKRDYLFSADGPHVRRSRSGQPDSDSQLKLVRSPAPTSGRGSAGATLISSAFGRVSPTGCHAVSLTA